MAKSTKRQRKTTGRVMHEFKHGELKRSRGGKGGKVKSRKQAIAIAMNEAGTSRYNSKKKNRRNFRRTEGKERRGLTAQQEREHRFGAKPRKAKTSGAEHRNRAAGARKAARTRKRKTGRTRK
jgi:hypothetical protein